jgi:hypothetical protein
VIEKTQPTLAGTPSDESPGILRFDAVDHVMTYLFAGADPLPAAVELNVEITKAGRAPYLLPDVARGVYRLEGTAAAPLGGAWWGAGVPMGQPYTSVDNEGLQITYCFLDDDPPAVAERLRPLLARRPTPLLAAPFYTPVPYDWDRHLP